MTRRAVTLVEALIAFALALTVLGLVIELSGRGSLLAGRTGDVLGALADVRALVDSAAEDIHSAVYLVEPESASDFERTGRLVVYRPASADPGARLKKNATDPEAAGFPYTADRETTVQHFDVRRIIYQREADPAQPGAFRVMRDEAGGYWTRTQLATGEFRHGFAVDATVPAPRAGRRMVAANLERFTVEPLALVPDAAVPGGRALVAPPAQGAKSAQIALVCLRAATHGREPVELATKVWIDERWLAFRFPEYFSSVDENLSY